MGLGKGMKSEAGLYSHPLHSFPWQGGKTAMDLTKDAKCKALLQAAINKEIRRKREEYRPGPYDRTLGRCS